MKHSDQEHTVKVFVLAKAGQPGQFPWQPGECPGLLMPGEWPD